MISICYGISETLFPIRVFPQENIQRLDHHIGDGASGLGGMRINPLRKYAGNLNGELLGGIRALFVEIFFVHLPHTFNPNRAKARLGVTDHSLLVIGCEL